MSAHSNLYADPARNAWLASDPLVGLVEPANRSWRNLIQRCWSGHRRSCQGRCIERILEHSTAVSCDPQESLCRMYL